MKRKVFFFMAPFWGHITPNLYFLEVLSLKYDVVCFCGEKFRGILKHQCAVFVPYPEILQETYISTGVVTEDIEKAARQYYSTQYEEDAMELNCAIEVRRARLAMSELAPYVEEYAPTLILMDSIITFPVILAEKYTIPYILVEEGTYQVFGEVDLYREYLENVVSKEINQLLDYDEINISKLKIKKRILRRYGEFLGNSQNAKNFEITPRCSIAFSSENLQIQSDFLRKDEHLLGFHMDVGQTVEKENRIFVTRGTLSDAYNVSLLKCIAETFIGHPYKVTVTCGSMIDKNDIMTDSLRAAPNIEIKNMVNQIAELKRSRVMVSHGGITGVREAIMCETPVIIFPNNYQGYQVGTALEKYNAGIMLREHPFSKEELRRAISTVLGDSRYRKHVCQLCEELLAYSKERITIPYIESLFQNT